MKLVTSDKNIEKLDVDGIVVGIFEENILGSSASRFEASLKSFLDLGDFKGKSGQKSLLYNIEGVSAKRVLLIGLGKQDKLKHDIIRTAASTAARFLRDKGIKNVAFEALGDDVQATAEGVVLGLYRYDELKFKNKDKLKYLDSVTFCGDADAWNKGVILAEGQNKARYLAETPANICHPTWFVERAREYLGELENIEIIVHDEAWAKEQGMGAFLSVAAGSDQPAKFLKIVYNGGNDGEAPLALVGKGITFDTGGISIKPSANMGAMKGDMGGAAVVIGSLYAIAKLGVKTNVVGITPLTENMPSGKATRPADVVTASNGKTIQVDNTDAEGRMILSDALVHVEKTHKPHTTIDIATLTGSMMVALGNAYAGAFTRSDDLWNELNEAGALAHDRFWRMPLDQIYLDNMKGTISDLKNTGGRAGGACSAAMFLGEFIEMERWCHLDIAGVMSADGKGYHPNGMSGRPTRSLVLLSEKFVK